VHISKKFKDLQHVKNLTLWEPLTEEEEKVYAEKLEAGS
jgi:hypothetical protein